MAKFNKKTTDLLAKIDRLEETEQNYIDLKNRWRRDVFKAKEEGMIKAVSDLSPAVDDISRAIEMADSRDDQELKESLKSIQKALIERFIKIGAVPFGQEGDDFDPHFYDAVSSEKGDPGKVIQIHSLGWKDTSGDLIKPATVTVGREK